MNLTFGMYLDGTEWSPATASTGEIQVGPQGMLSVLETRLGLTGPRIHPARRINQFLRRALSIDSEEQWFHRSLAADEWSTAKQLLSWRDELITAGWTGQGRESTSERLRTLAVMESLDLPLAPGVGDRLRETLRQLSLDQSIDLLRVQLREPSDLLPAIWRDIFSRLRGIGVEILEPPEQHLDPRPTLLGLVKAALVGAKGPVAPVPADDDSLVLVRAPNEWEAAEQLAIWLAADAQENSRVTIICGGSTNLLDAALRRSGLPRIGFDGPSPWRGHTQVLPLVLANVWDPIDIHRLVELLSLDASPIPDFARQRLLVALNREAGIGGSAWNEALNEIAGVPPGKTQAKSVNQRLAKRLDAFLVTDRYPPDTGIPAERLIERCNWILEGWADMMPGDPLLSEAAGHVSELIAVAEGRGTIPRRTLERIVDSIVGSGGEAPDRIAEAAPWNIVIEPGQITSPASTVVWWGFIEPQSPGLTFWNESEKRDLEGIETEDPRIRRRRESRAWNNAALSAADRLLMFFPMVSAGAENVIHPFWDILRSTAVRTLTGSSEDEVEQRLVRDFAKLTQTTDWSLAGRQATLQSVTVVPPTAIPAIYDVPPGCVLPGDHLSYTQMNSLLSCPMNWVLKYHAGLQLSRSQSVATGNKMIGTFCHRIVEELYPRAKTHWEPEDAAKRAVELYDHLLPSMAAELLAEGKEVENKRYRRAVVEAVRSLVRTINSLGLVVEKSEARFEREFDGRPFVGRVDLLLKAPDETTFVMDLKWSNWVKGFEDEIKDGAALQLATYAWLLQSQESHSGFFLLPKGRLLSDSELLGGEKITAARTPIELWKLAARTWEERLRAINQGHLEATGITEGLLCEEGGLSEQTVQEGRKKDIADRGLLYRPPQCRFCDFGGLCGKAGGNR